MPEVEDDVKLAAAVEGVGDAGHQCPGAGAQGKLGQVRGRDDGGEAKGDGQAGVWRKLEGRQRCRRQRRRQGVVIGDPGKGIGVITPISKVEGVGLGIIGTERIGTHQFGQAVGLVGVGTALGAHFV